MSDTPNIPDAPNQQLVRADGSGPADEGTGGEVAARGPEGATLPADAGQPADADAGGYDPGEDTVDAVLDHLSKHPEDRDAVLEAERAGKARKGILEHVTEPDDDES
jgi:hypothetical protein